MTKRKVVQPDLIDLLLADYQKPEDLIGENGILKQLTKAIVELALQAELAAHLGHDKHETVVNESGNMRNGSNGHICGPQTSAAYCDHDAYERLMYPEPTIANWEKSDVTAEQKLKDWSDCGDTSNGRLNPSAEAVRAEMRVEDKEPAVARTRLTDISQRCLINKGYSWTGECKTTFERFRPACGGQGNF